MMVLLTVVTLLLFKVVFAYAVSGDPHAMSFDRLYTLGIAAYEEERWFQCVSFISRAIEEHSYYSDVMYKCRLQCKQDSDINSGATDFVHDHGEHLLNLLMFQNLVKTVECVRKCKLKNLGEGPRALNIFKSISRAFNELKPYDYLQICAFQIMGRKKTSRRHKTEANRLAMRTKRSGSAAVDKLSESASAEPGGPWEPVHEVDKSLGSRMPTPSGSEFLNAGVLSTHSGSLSIPVAQNRNVKLTSDSPSCVCTPPSVPLSSCDGAGQTKATDRRVSLPECNSGSEIMRKVERNMKQRTIDETLSKPHANERSINQSQNISPHPHKPIHQCERSIKQTPNNFPQFPVRETHSRQLHQSGNEMKTKSPKHTSENISEDMDVIYVQYKEPEIYKFNPLNTSSKKEITKLLNINATQVSQEIVPNREVLGIPIKTHPTTGDGNCFFRALSYTLTGTEQHYRLLRNKIIYHMLDNAALYNCHLRSGYRTVSNYVDKKRMLRDGVWATEVEILAAADLLNTQLFVFEESNASWIKFSPRQVHGDCVDLSENSIYLVHKYQAHYDVVLDVRGEETVEPFAGNKQTLYYIGQSAKSSYRGPILSNSYEKQLVSELPPVIQGHFNQSDARFLHNAGKQCVMNSLSALLYSQQKPTISWSANDVDQILVKGNDMYEFVQRSGKVHHDFLLISDIPKSMAYNGLQYGFTFHESFMGRLGGEPLREFNFYSLKDALMISLLQNPFDAAFITFKNSTYIVIKQNNLFCVSDSHARSKTGTVCPYGSSTVIHYSKIEDVFHHTLSLAESMAYTDCDEFEVTPVNVTEVIKPDEHFPGGIQKNTAIYKTAPTLQDINVSLQHYLIDQKQKLAIKETKRIELGYETSTLASTRKEYMCMYMRKRRSDKAKRKELQEADTLRKQKARHKDQQKQRYIDLVSKRKLRKDAIFLNAQRKSMAASRKNEPKKYRDIDRVSKRKLRKDLNVLNAEKKSKMASRENEPKKYREIDLASKRKLRKDPNFLSAEKKSKMASRENEPNKYREIDLASKRKLRKDPNFLSAEKKSKMASRENEPNKYREIDLASKRKLRKDPNFLNAEKKSKMASRENEPKKYREIDLASKRRFRKDRNFLNAEKKSKMASRENEPNKYREIDLASKRQLRKDRNFLNAEKKSKMASRENEPKKYREIDLASKRKLRKDPQFLNAEKKVKMASRKNEPQKYKDIDLAHKRKARGNVLFLQKERISKKMARVDSHFLKKEAEADKARKQKLRLHKTFLDQERLKQSERRKNRPAQQKYHDRKRKAVDRSCHSLTQAEHEQYKQRKYGQDVQQCIQKFYAKVERGPEYVCTICHQTWFIESVVESCNHKFPNMRNVSTGFTSVDGKEWICNTCLVNLKKGKIPRLAVANGMKWPEKPAQLDLHPLEERLVALRIPFMQIRELPRGGQFSTKGNVVNIPIDLQPTITALPRRMDEYFAIPVKLKKRISHKSHVYSENVRPNKIFESLNWLMNNSDLYKKSGVKINAEWGKDTAETSEETMREFIREPNLTEENVTKQDNLDNSNSTKQHNSFDEINDDDCNQGNSDTLVDEVDLCSNKTLVLAPGENQQPLSLYHDKHAEVLSFPSIYCGQKRLENDSRKVPVPYSDLAKWELRSVDRRAATCVPNIFFKLHKIQRKQVADKVNLAVRRKKTEGKKITAKEARKSETADKIVSLNEGYYIFRTLRNSPAYLSSRKKDIFAMIRQLGLPTWFMSLSCADTRWPELLKTLAAFSGIPCSDEDICNMTWNDKAKLVQKDPVTACRYFDHRVQVFMNTVLKSEHSPIGIVTDSFQRVEFQNRGSPHVHMMIWTKSAPKYKEDSDQEIEQFVEKHVSCSQDVDEDMQDLIKIQTHKHSKTCKKGGRPVCRFGFPLPPLKRTMVLEPLEVEVEKYREKYKELHGRMNELMDECYLSYDEFLETIVQMSEEDYIKCIRSSLKGPKVFLKRKPSEMRVNYYNKTVLKAWGANIDLQFVLDPYACAMYIVSYISKSQRGMSVMLEQASKEAAAGNMDLKRQVRHIGNKFLNFVEVSAQEAAYLVLQMPLTRSSRHVVFINTSPPEERVFLLKSQEELEKLPDSSTDIHSDNMIQRYSKRPKQLEKYCLADYISELKVQFQKRENKDSECNEDDIKIADSADESGSEEEAEFTDSSIILKLRNGLTIRKRKHPRVIRYVRYSAKTNSENFYREKLLLFMPWRSEEIDLKGEFGSHEDHFLSIQEDLIPTIKKYEHFIEELDLAREQAENDILEFESIAPCTEQAEAEDEAKSVNNSDQFIHFFPPTASECVADVGQDIGLSSIRVSTETISPLLSEPDYRSLIRSLNTKQTEFFSHVLKWVSTKSEPLYAFLSGGAGVGKSVVIRSLYQALYRQLNSEKGDDPDSIKVLLTAFTGKAAYNINGCTIASAFHKKIFQKEQHMYSDELNTFRSTYKDLKVIIIDEISMVGNKLLAFINQRLQELTGTKRDFGGISIIAVGDLYQLSPVADSWIFNDLSIGLATNLWRQHFHLFELTEIMRQKDDLNFAAMLNRLRINQLTAKDRDIIKSRMTSENSSTCPQIALYLFTENKRVDEFNRSLIQKLHGLKVEVKADTDVISPSNLSKESKSNLIKEINKKEKHSETGNLPSILKIAVGMIYDVSVNVDVRDGLTNGASLVVQHIEYKGGIRQRPAIVWVLFDDPKIGVKRRNQYKQLYSDDINSQWTPIFEVKRTFLYNKKTYERIQFPLNPAAAKTVHKAQGTTVDELVVDLRSSFKAPHIHYVALSRVRNLANLYIVDFNEKALKVDEKVHKEMERLKSKQLQLCFTPLYDINKNNLKLIFHNARSLHRHIEDVRKDPNVQCADIIGIAETRLCATDSFHMYDIPGFQMHRIDEAHSDSQTRPYHGLIVYARHDVNLNKLYVHTFDGIEYALFDATHNAVDFHIMFLYKSPNIADKNLMKCFQMIHTLLNTEKPLFIMGDFNINIWQNSSRFPQFMTDLFSCKQIISEPTTKYNTLIDHIYTNVRAQATVIPTYWSDHSLICCYYPLAGF